MKRSAPWYLVAPAVAAALGIAAPLLFLASRALGGDGPDLADLLLRARTARLLGNSLFLAVSVVAATTAISLPAAWLVTSTNLPGRRLFTLAAVLPLAMPGYVLAYAMLGVGGPLGTSARWLGFELPRPSGFSGSLIALALYNFPFMFLNLRAAFDRLDPSLSEAARSLGATPREVFRRITFPALRPAFLSGALVVGLYVMGDFGVVGLMRYETLSFAILSQFSAAHDLPSAAALALLLLVVIAILLVLEFRLLRGLRLHRAGLGTSRRRARVVLGRRRWVAVAALSALFFASVAGPAIVLIEWAWRGGAAIETVKILRAVGHSLSGAVPGALIATALAVPIAFLARRFHSRSAEAIERVAYVGFATPAIVFALGILFFVLKAVPMLYQTMFALIAAYALHFLAQAIGPVRAGLFLASPRAEEAARALGHGPISTFFRVTFPQIRAGVVAALTLVLLSCLKDLPLTYVLAPLDFEPLALEVWSYANEAMFAEAAPYALAMLALSGLLVGLLIRFEAKGDPA